MQHDIIIKSIDYVFFLIFPFKVFYKKFIIILLLYYSLTR